MNLDDDAPSFQPPSKTAVDDFLSSSSRSSTSSRSALPMKNGGMHTGTRAKYSNSSSSSSSSSRPTRVTPASSSSRSSSSKRSLKVHTVSTSTSTKRAIVSPMQSASSSASSASPSKKKIKMSRKTLNKLKRKRLEETSNSCRVDFLFSSNTTTMQCDLTSLSHNSRQGQSQSHAQIRGCHAMSVLRNGTLLVDEMISLNPDAKNLIRWPLHRHSDGGRKRTATSMDNASLLDFIHKAKSQKLPRFSLSSNDNANHDDKSKSNTSMSTRSIAAMLTAMQAGLAIHFRPHNYDTDASGRTDEYRFIAIPEKDKGENGNGLLTLICMNDDIGVPSRQDDSSASASASDRNALNSNSNENKGGNQNYTEISKRVKISRPLRETNADVSSTRKQGDDSDAKIHKSMQWDELIAQYTSCLAQSDGAVSPHLFVREMLPAAVTTLWIEHDKENENKNGTESGDRYNVDVDVDSRAKISGLFQLFRHLRPSLDMSGAYDAHSDVDGNRAGAGGAGHTLLRLKPELSAYLMNRRRTGTITSAINNVSSQNAGQGGGEKSNDASDNEHIRAMLLQVLIRIELFIMHSDDDESSVKRRFLKSFSGCTPTRDPNQVQNRKSKKSKKAKKRKKENLFSTNDYAMELCSIIELFPFLLPSPDSFSSFTSEKILEPYRLKAPELVEKIAEFFEIELVEGVESTSSTNEESNPNVIEKNVTSEPAIVSRWANPVISNSVKVNPIASPVKPISPVKQESSEAMIERESEEVVLLRNTNALAVKTRQKNPLLADSKGKYVGRQFSNNYFRTVNVVKYPGTKKEKPSLVNKKTNQNSNATVTKKAAKDSKHQHRAVASLGAFSLPFRKQVQPKVDAVGRSRNSSGTKSKSGMPPPTRHPHAAVMAALAAMRKKNIGQSNV